VGQGPGAIQRFEEVRARAVPAGSAARGPEAV